MTSNQNPEHDKVLASLADALKHNEAREQELARVELLVNTLRGKGFEALVLTSMGARR